MAPLGKCHRCCTELGLSRMLCQKAVHDVVAHLPVHDVAALVNYRPEPVLAQLADGSVIPALCFNLPVPPSTDERNPEYVSKLTVWRGGIRVHAAPKVHQFTEGAFSTPLIRPE